MSEKIASTGALALTRDVSVSFDWKGFISNLADAAANFVVKGWADGGASGLGALLKAVTTINVELPPSNKAWSLIALSFASTLDEFRSGTPIDREQLRQILHTGLDEARDIIDKGSASIDRDFLTTPSSSLLYQAMRDIIVSEKLAIGQEFIPDGRLSARLDSLFNAAVFHVWSNSPETYASISEILNNPVADAIEFELGWMAYRQELINIFTSNPTFGQERTGITLSQLYVPLRAFWRHHRSGEKGPPSLTQGIRPTTAQMVMLNDELELFVADTTDNKDKVRLVGGGPGSGKSTSLKALAAKLATQDDIRPLFVPLQHIGIARDLRESINLYFSERAGSPFRQAPLSRKALEHGPRLVIIFDGLDELVAPNESASDVVNLFVAKVNDLSSSMAVDGFPTAKFIISGRMLTFQTAKRLLSVKAHGCLETFGYAPATASKAEGATELWRVDQRPIWWSNYTAAKGEISELPLALESEALASITGEPLLCYLLVLSGFATHNWDLAADNPNRIYSALMKDVYDRGWGEDSLRKKAVTLTDFTQLMQTFGLAAWLGGDARVASEESFKSALPVTRAEGAWQRFNDDNGADVSNLAINFYLKAPENNNRGFEFTHKSFGEYLAAVAILEVALDLGALIDRRIDHALLEWLDATKSGLMSSEILTFMRNEVRLRVEGIPQTAIDQIIGVKARFERMATDVLRVGFPLVAGENSRTNDRLHLNSEAALWAIINSISLALRALGRTDEALVNVSDLDGFGLNNLISRHVRHVGTQETIIYCLSSLKLDRVYLFGGIYHGLDISHSRVRHSLLLHGLTVSNCNLDSVTAERLSIYGCTMSNTLVTNIKTDIFEIYASNLSGVNISAIDSKRFISDPHSILMSGIDEFEGVGPKLFVRYDEPADREIFRATPRTLEFIASLDEDAAHEDRNLNGDAEIMLDIE